MPRNKFQSATLVTCPNCSTENDATLEFCTRCGDLYDQPRTKRGSKSSAPSDLWSTVEGQRILTKSLRTSDLEVGSGTKKGRAPVMTELPAVVEAASRIALQAIKQARVPGEHIELIVMGGHASTGLPIVDACAVATDIRLITFDSSDPRSPAANGCLWSELATLEWIEDAGLIVLRLATIYKHFVEIVDFSKEHVEALVDFAIEHSERLSVKLGGRRTPPEVHKSIDANAVGEPFTETDVGDDATGDYNRSAQLILEAGGTLDDAEFGSEPREMPTRGGAGVTADGQSVIAQLFSAPSLSVMKDEQVEQIVEEQGDTHASMPDILMVTPGPQNGRTYSTNGHETVGAGTYLDEAGEQDLGDVAPFVPPSESSGPTHYGTVSGVTRAVAAPNSGPLIRPRPNKFAATIQSTDDPMTKLKLLRDLLEAGLINVDDFERKKAEILAKL